MEREGEGDSPTGRQQALPTLGSASPAFDPESREEGIIGKAVPRGNLGNGPSSFSRTVPSYACVSSAFGVGDRGKGSNGESPSLSQAD